MTSCPDIGTWRAWLDGEAAITGPDEHLAICADCAAAVADLREDASFAGRTLAVLARRDLRDVRPAAPVAAVSLRGSRHVRRWLEAAAAVAVIGVFLATPIGRAAAESFMSVFRVQRFDLVTVTASEAVQTADALMALGVVDGVSMPTPVVVDSVAQIRSEYRIDLPTPAALGSPDVAYVLPSTSVRWTLDAEAVSVYLSRHGSAMALPDGLDGATLVLDRADAAVAVYGSVSHPDLVVGVSGPVTAHTDGELSLGELRTFLLSLPGLPDGLVAQLRSIDDWTATLPVPVPIELGRGQKVRLGTTEAVSFTAPGIGAGYLWTRDGDVVGVMAPSSTPALEAIATELSR